MKRLGLLCLLLAACETGPPSEPESSSASIKLANPLDVATSSSLRAALVWTFDEVPETRLVTTADVAASVGESVEIALRMPDDDLLERLVPRDRAQFTAVTSGDLSIAVHRPRLVVYEDIDASGSFEPNMLGKNGPDRVIAVDFAPQTIAAVLDLEGLLEQLPIEEIGIYYGASRGSFTPFLKVHESGGTLSFDVWDPAVSLILDDSGFPEASLRCLRPSSSDLDQTIVVVLDSGIDPALCGKYDCFSQDLATTPPPELKSVKTWSVVRAAHCRQLGELESLVIERSNLVCSEDCSCKTEEEVRVFVANQATLPSWWPCGAVPYCESAESLTDHEPTCS